MTGEGPVDPEGILIGESPGPNEAEEGRPFVGKTGQDLTDELIGKGLRRSKLYIVNAICCLPPLNKTEPMMKRAADACRPALIAQLDALQQPLPPVLMMGKWAAYGAGVRQKVGRPKLAKMKGIMNQRGFVREWSLDQTKAVEAIVKKKSEVKKRKKKKE